MSAAARAHEPVELPDLTGDSFPLDTFRDAAVELRRPFAVKALQWKVQTMFPKGRDEHGKQKKPEGGFVVCYIDRGLVIDRLNCVVPHLWRADYKDAGRDNLMICRLTIDGITREDVGEARDVKARYSDSLKRVAVHFGVGVSLARIPKSRLLTKDDHVVAKDYSGDGKWSLELTQKGLDYLRARYTHWLEEVGEKTFGKPLEHGDLGDAQGDGDTPSDLVDADEKVLLYERLTGTRTMRRVRGLLSGAGVPGLPLEIRAEDAERAMHALTGEQAEKLRALLDKADEEAPDVG